jgi:tetratricopeptide (TPR) repeat protein
LSYLAAVGYFRSVLAVRPGATVVYSQLGDALVRSGQAEEAIDNLLRATAIDPGSAHVRNEMGIALEAKGRMEEAIEQYEQALQVQTDCWQAHYNFGRALKKRGRLDEAIVHLRLAIEIEPRDVDARREFARALSDGGRIKEAMDEVESLVRTNPGSADLHDECAWVVALSAVLSSREYELALRHARTAVELKPRDGEVYNTLALTEYRTGNWEGSIAAALRSEELLNVGDPTNWFILSHAPIAWHLKPTGTGADRLGVSASWDGERARLRRSSRDGWPWCDQQARPSWPLTLWAQSTPTPPGGGRLPR